MNNSMILYLMAGGYTIAIVAGCWLFLKTKKFLANAVKTQGIVVGSKGHLTIDMRGDTNAPVVEFKTPDGKKHTFEGRVTVPWKKPIGTSMAVLYDPKNPSEAVLDSWVELHMPWMICLSVGVIGLIALAVMPFFFS